MKIGNLSRLATAILFLCIVFTAPVQQAAADEPEQQNANQNVVPVPAHVWTRPNADPRVPGGHPTWQKFQTWFKAHGKAEMEAAGVPNMIQQLALAGVNRGPTRQGLTTKQGHVHIDPSATALAHYNTITSGRPRKVAHNVFLRFPGVSQAPVYAIIVVDKYHVCWQIDFMKRGGELAVKVYWPNTNQNVVIPAVNVINTGAGNGNASGNGSQSLPEFNQ